MTMIVAYMILALLAVLIFLYRFVRIIEQSANYKNLNKAVDEINKAKDIRHKLNHDADYAARVREKFTRK